MSCWPFSLNMIVTYSLINTMMRSRVCNLPNPSSFFLLAQSSIQTYPTTSIVFKPYHDVWPSYLLGHYLVLRCLLFLGRPCHHTHSLVHIPWTLCRRFARDMGHGSWSSTRSKPKVSCVLIFVSSLRKYCFLRLIPQCGGRTRLIVRLFGVISARR